MPAHISAPHAQTQSDRAVPVATTTAVKKQKVASSPRAGKSASASAATTAQKRAALSEKERREKRRAQNRLNAAKCRQRKIDRVSTLSEELEDLQKENDTLKAALDMLEARYHKRFGRSP